MSCGIGGITSIICEDKVTSIVDGFPIAVPAWVSELNTEIKVFRFKLDLYRDHCIKTCKIDEKDIADLMLYRAGLALVKALEQVNLVPLTGDEMTDNRETFSQEDFVEIIEEWRDFWADQPPENYRVRASVIDMNMIFNLANRLMDRLQTRRDGGVTGLPLEEQLMNEAEAHKRMAAMYARAEDRIKELEAKVERLKLENLALHGNLGHPVPSDLKLPVAARNVLAEFIAKERDRLRVALEKIADVEDSVIDEKGHRLTCGEIARKALKGQG